MRNRDRQRIGRIRARELHSGQQHLEHRLNLRLVRRARADNRLLDEALARAGLPVAEYATRLVKKAIVGTGAADKAQVQAMLKVLLPGVKLAGADAADALAVAIAHAHIWRG